MTGEPVTVDLAVLEEARGILAIAKGDALKAFEMVERQLGVLVVRTQVLLSLSGIVITVTGFSGRAIAETSSFARGSISTGVIVVLLGALWVILGVLRLDWLTRAIVEDPLETVVRGLRVRDAKGASLRAGYLLFAIGFSLYVFAIAQLLVATPTRG